MQRAFGDFILLLKKMGLVMLLYSICRLAFYVLNSSHFDSKNLLLSFLGGMRFDLSAIAYINAIFVILFLLPFRWRENKNYKTFVNVLFLSINAIGLFFNTIDFELFKFTLKRSTFDFFTLINTGDDFLNLIPQYLKDYWYVLLFFILIVWLLIKANKEIEKRHVYKKWEKTTPVYSFIFFLLAIGLTVVAARSGFQLRPLSIINASTYGSSKNSALILNTPFTMMKSYKAIYIDNKEYFPPKEQKAIYNADRQYDAINLGMDKDNVIVLILESFSYEYMNKIGEHGKPLTPFLDSLSKKSLFFPKAYANGKKSIEGIPSVCTSIPSLMTNPFIFSPYSANKTNSIASVLKSNGYSSSFFHGGINGTMGFDAFAKSSGYDRYFGKEEYNNDDDYDGTWGIFDEHFYHFFIQELNKEKEPFTSTFFSLSSHHPYTIPKEYQSKFVAAKNPYESVIQYSDFALEKFFEEAKKQDWYQHTLFVITADHTAPSTAPYYMNREGSYRVPLLFFHPTKIQGKSDLKIAQQIDILPTVADFLDIENDFVAFGKSLLRNEYPFSFQYIGNIYQIEDKHYHLEFDGEKSTALYDIQTDSLLQHNMIQPKLNAALPSEVKELEMKLKAVIQEYNSRMINNKLVAE